MSGPNRKPADQIEGSKDGVDHVADFTCQEDGEGDQENAKVSIFNAQPCCNSGQGLTGARRRRREPGLAWIRTAGALRQDRMRYNGINDLGSPGEILRQSGDG